MVENCHDFTRLLISRLNTDILFVVLPIVYKQKTSIYAGLMIFSLFFTYSDSIYVTGITDLEDHALQLNVILHIF